LDQRPGASREWRNDLNHAASDSKSFFKKQTITSKEKNYEEGNCRYGGFQRFRSLAARALAKAGHVVYASMRDTSGRNKGQVQEAAKFAADNKADLRTVDVLSDTSANAAVKKIIDDT
jgi:hypothetical protein